MQNDIDRATLMAGFLLIRHNDFPNYPCLPHCSQLRGSGRQLRANDRLSSRSYRPGSHFENPLCSGHQRKVIRRLEMPVANAVLTTVVDTWSRPWTPRCPSRSSGQIRRTAVDSCRPGRSPENRMITSRWSPVSRRCGPATSRSAAATMLPSWATTWPRASRRFADQWFHGSRGAKLHTNRAMTKLEAPDLLHSVRGTSDGGLMTRARAAVGWAA